MAGPPAPAAALVKRRRLATPPRGAPQETATILPPSLANNSDVETLPWRDRCEPALAGEPRPQPTERLDASFSLPARTATAGFFIAVLGQENSVAMIALRRRSLV